MTKAPKRSGGLVLEAVWCVGAGGLGRCKGWETSGSQTPTKTGSGRERQTASGTGTAHRSERALPVKRGMAVLAHRH
jgi:hypothetical protein